jgi:proteasome beta subunit
VRAFLEPHETTVSFVALLARHQADLLPRFAAADLPAEPKGALAVPHGTTILALRYREGVIITGDRQATEGYQVSARRIEKVYRTDAYSAIAIAGAAGPCLEMARLFQTELEHYEKLEGAHLSLDGKANKLAQMVRMNLALALQGLVVIPLFAGYDVRRGEGKIFKYDVAGGRYEETEYHATGSGGKDARGTLKKLYRPDLDEAGATRVACEALFDAAEEDVGTGRPDFVRGIFPTAKVITRDGLRDVGEADVRAAFQQIVDARRGS